MSLAMPISAMSAQAAGHAGSVMHVSATVLAHATTKIVHQATHITITKHDIKKGYVDAHEASIFTVTALPGSTYFLVFHPRVDILNCCQFRSTTKESFSIVNHCSKIG